MSQYQQGAQYLLRKLEFMLWIALPVRPACCAVHIHGTELILMSSFKRNSSLKIKFTATKVFKLQEWGYVNRKLLMFILGLYNCQKWLFSKFRNDSRGICIIIFSFLFQTQNICTSGPLMCLKQPKGQCFLKYHFISLNSYFLIISFLFLYLYYACFSGFVYSSYLPSMKAC